MMKCRPLSKRRQTTATRPGFVYVCYRRMWKKAKTGISTHAFMPVLRLGCRALANFSKAGQFLCKRLRHGKNHIQSWLKEQFKIFCSLTRCKKSTAERNLLKPAYLRYFIVYTVQCVIVLKLTILADCPNSFHI